MSPHFSIKNVLTLALCSAMCVLGQIPALADTTTAPVTPVATPSPAPPPASSSASSTAGPVVTDPAPTSSPTQPAPTFGQSALTTPKAATQQGGSAEQLAKYGAHMGMTTKLGPAAGTTPESAPTPYYTAQSSEPSVPEQPTATRGQPLGLDVSGWQGNVDWNYVTYMKGARFAYVKASEGTWASNSYFAQQYNGSAATGLVRGAYHFARPNLSRGADQAAAFIASGGGWSPDGQTLPGALDIEEHPDVYNGAPYYEGLNMCYNMSPSQLSDWVADFVGYYGQTTGKAAMIYSSSNFWNTCMAGSARFSQTNPLWGASWFTNSPGQIGGWPYYTVWQYANDCANSSCTTAATFPGDQDVFNGTMSQLISLATTPDYPRLNTPPDAAQFSGKWYGDGKSYLGWMLNGQWCLQRPSNAPLCFLFGNPGDKPVVGDWNGDGTTTIGVVRNDHWFLSNSLTGGTIDASFSFGVSTDVPVTGDWAGTGRTGIGIFRDGLWALSNAPSGSPAVSGVAYFGQSGDVPVTGDWDANGSTTIGIFRTNLFALNNTVNSSAVATAFMFGDPGDRPVTGDWDGNRSATVGVRRGQNYYLTNSNESRTIDSIVW